MVSIDNVAIGTGETTVTVLFSGSNLVWDEAALLADSTFNVWENASTSVIQGAASVTVTPTTDGLEAEFVVELEQATGLPLLYFLPNSSNAVRGRFGEKPLAGEISGTGYGPTCIAGQLTS